MKKQEARGTYRACLIWMLHYLGFQYWSTRSTWVNVLGKPPARSPACLTLGTADMEFRDSISKGICHRNFSENVREVTVREVGDHL